MSFAGLYGMPKLVFHLCGQPGGQPGHRPEGALGEGGGDGQEGEGGGLAGENLIKGHPQEGDVLAEVDF